MKTNTNILQPLTIETAPEGSRAALEGVKKGFGFIPNLMGTFANSPAVLNGYLALDSHWEKSSLSPVERQLVLLAASVSNECGYCTAAHSTILKKFMHVDASVVAALRAGTPLADPRQQALVAFTTELVAGRGHVSDTTRDVFFAAGFTPAQAMEVLLGVSLKTISNYLDHLSPTPIDAPFAAEA